MKTIITTAVLVALGFLIHWRIKGVSATKEEVSKFVIITAAPLIVFVTDLLLHNVFRAPYLVYIEEHAKAQDELGRVKQRAEDAETGKAQAESAKQVAEARAKELEKRLEVA